MIRLVLALCLAVSVYGQSQQSRCLSNCMRLNLQNSQIIQQNDFTSICRTYERTADCISRCSNNNNWRNAAFQLVQRCNSQLNNAVNRFQRCYQNNLGRAQFNCASRCSGGSTSFLTTRSQDFYCYTNACYFPCITNEVNRNGCAGAGAALQNVFYSPYISIYNTPIFWPFYNEATWQVAPWCRRYYYADFPLSNSGGIGISSVAETAQPAVAGAGVPSGAPSLPSDQQPTSKPANPRGF